MPTNHVKAALKAGKAVTGPILHEVRSAGMIKLLAVAGHDFVFIDTEHGLYDMETVGNLVQMALACGVCPLVRPSDLQYHLVARALDTGAQGVIIPRVQSAEEAALAVSYVKYPPLGRRGAGGEARFAFEKRGVREGIEELNDETLVIIQIESSAGVENVEAIAATPGVDVILIGPNDLSISLGVPGDYQSETFTSAIDRILAASQSAGIAIGTLTMSGEATREWYERGFRFLLCNSDTNMLAEAAARDVAEMRAFIGDEG